MRRRDSSSHGQHRQSHESNHEDTNNHFSDICAIDFIAGIYGMNFNNMPELQWHYGYFACLIVMTLVATVQSWFLWKRGWFEDWTTSRS